MKLGIDFGSKNISYAVIKGETIITSAVITHNGDINGTLKKIIEELFNSSSEYNIEYFGITGTVDAGSLKITDTILASVEANKFLGTGCRNILYIGCETFYLIRLDEELNYIEHTVNSDCASGTGSFIDQQAERLKLTTEELGIQAYKFEGEAPTIATRCAVFAKSDIIHAQARGFSKDAIGVGICEGVSRNVTASTVKGRKLKGSILLTGGVSRNLKIRNEISKILKQEIKTITEGSIFNAVGCAILASIEKENIDLLLSQTTPDRDIREALEIKLTDYPDFTSDEQYISDEVEITIYEDISADSFDIYIGIDIGSTSTKAVITDPGNRILAGLYSKTEGDPVFAVKRLFEKINSIFKEKKL
ncbi:MAG: hypothetical protein KAS39_06770, partial [Actinomycetia bacterium]|nr:hypothetical protein [Actinomycetes bacterium]